jgi:hypothetical protein
MTRMETLLRAATRETAAEVTTESIPPLDVTTLPVGRQSLPRGGGPLSPLLAAAGVVLVVALSVALGTMLTSHRPSARPSASSVNGGLAGVPPYYAALTATGTPAAIYPETLTVRSTSTGQVLATATAPRPYGTFILVEGTADDRTFLVAAQEWHPVGQGIVIDNIRQPVRLYLLHFDPATVRTSLTALPIPQLNGQYLQDASISPDGTRVAVGYLAPEADNPAVYATSVRIYSLPGGAERTITVTQAQVKDGGLVSDRDNPATLAWAANDRTMSFTWGGYGLLNGVHVLDTDVAGTHALISASRLVLPMGTTAGSSDFSCSSDAFLSANGAYILCGGFTVPKGWPGIGLERPFSAGFAEFSAATGKLVTILGRQTGRTMSGVPYLLWASPSATVLIGTVDGRGFVVRDGREQTIPWSSGIAGTEGSSIPAIASW